MINEVVYTYNCDKQKPHLMNNVIFFPIQITVFVSVYERNEKNKVIKYFSWENNGLTDLIYVEVE
jgi:hypothetical protein